MVRAVDLEVQFEIVELARGFQVGAMILIDEEAILDGPMAVGGIADGFPAFEGFAVKQRFGSTPCRGTFAREERSADAGQRYGIGAGFLGARELIAGGVEFPGNGRARLPWAGEMFMVRCDPSALKSFT